MKYQILDVTDWGMGHIDPNSEIPHGRGKKIATLKQRRGCDYETAVALYEGRAVEIVEPTIVIFKKPEE